MKRSIAVAAAAACLAGMMHAAEPSKTALGNLAASLQPGEMKELQTQGLDRGLLKSWYDWEEDNIKKYGSQKMFNIIASWSHDACWDPVTRQVLFIGIGHYASLKFVTYSAVSNAWTLMPVPTWCDPRHPERQFQEKKQAPRAMGSYPFGIHGVMEYNPVHKVMIFGGGDGGETGNRTFYRIDAQGKIEKLKPAPIHVNCRESSKLLCDPVSGEFLAQEFGSRKVYAYHPIRDEWKKIEGVKFPNGLGVAVDTYGVLMFCAGTSGYGGKVYLYRHKPQWSSEPETSSGG